MKQILIASSLILVLIFIPFVFTSCVSESIGQLAEGGVKFNKVIYAINPEEYFDGRTPAEDVYNKEGKDIYYQKYTNLYFLETDKLGVYDMVIGPSDENGGMLSATQSANILYCSDYGSKIQCPLFDCNYMFSGIHQRFYAGGGWACDDHDCICGADNIDTGDNTWQCSCKMPNQSQPKSITVETELTLEEILENLEIKCGKCYSYDTIQNEDGTITYNRTSICSHGVTFIHDGTFADIRKKYFGNSNPKELIIDGFDFSLWYDTVTNYSYYSGYIGNWFVRYQPESYNHMFSDLSVEKITIKNVTGLSNAKDLSSMFENCPNLKTVEFGNMFEGCQPTNISRMFYNCPKLEYVDLSSLDTSCVTDMSEMFALSGGFITAEARDFELERIINKYVQTDEEFAVFNDGTVYTIDSFISKVYELYGLNATKEDLYILFDIREITLTYDEYCYKNFGANLIGVYNLVNQDPDSFGLSSNHGEYDIFEIIKWLEEIALSEGVDIVHEMELQEVKSRDDMLNFFINNTIVPITQELDNNETYNVDMLAEIVGVPKAMVVCEIVSKLSEAKSTIIPVSYNEAVCYSTNGEMTFDEMVTEILRNQEEYLQPKEDGSKYSRSEIKELLKTEIDSDAIEMGVVLVDDIELDNYYVKHLATAEKLILGGENSKFIVNNDTNVKNMFGTSSIFKEIITPNEIGDEIEIVLYNKYTETKIPDGTPVEDESIFVLTLTSQDANKIYYCYNEFKEEEPVEPEPPVDPEVPNKEESADLSSEEMQIRKYVVMFVFLTLILVIVIITIRIAIKLNRRRRIKRFV